MHVFVHCFDLKHIIIEKNNNNNKNYFNYYINIFNNVKIKKIINF